MPRDTTKGMIVRRARLLLALLIIGLLALPVAKAATPSSGTVTAEPDGSDTLTYSGSVAPGAGASTADECDTSTSTDVFDLNVNIPSGFYTSNNARLNVRIEWDPTIGTVSNQDLALEIERGDGTDQAYSDGGASNESVAVLNPAAGHYNIIVCAFSVVTEQPYRAQVSLNSTRKAVESLPAPSDARGLQFMPIVTVDPQRGVAEPSLRYDKDGNIYACGPFGASRAADYAQMSLDNGDTFRVLGEPPEGRIAPGGGGDCEISTAPNRNSLGNYNLSYTGLESLLNFSTGLSADEGRTFTSSIFSSSVPLVDRQWMESHGADEVYLFYNQIPAGGTLQRSNDGGLTYAPASAPGNAASPIFRPGNIVIDHTPADSETVYGAYTDGNFVKVFKATNNGTTFSTSTVVEAEGRPDNLFPSIAIDTQENLYVAWTEKGSFNTYYSFSTNGAQTWSNKRLVNRRGAPTNVMPWIEAGSPGRVAVSFYCSPVNGDPELGSFRGPWDVCMNQSTNALGPGTDFSQVRVTHHPIHWNSICLSGLACTTSGGDRTLLDFFQTRVDPRDGRVSVAFNESNKSYDAPEGRIPIVTWAKQKSGPSLFASRGTVPSDPRAIIRSSSSDPIGDALFDFSSLNPTPPPRRENVGPLDFTNLTATRTTSNGKKAIRFRMTLNQALTDANLTQAALDMNASAELKFVVRYFSAYRADYVIANYDVATGEWRFFEGNLATSRCETTADAKLELYPAGGVGRNPIPGNVDETNGTIDLTIRYNQIEDIDIRSNPALKPALGPAQSGDQIWEVTAFTFGRPQVGQPQQGAVCPIEDYYNQADSTPSFDYRLPQ